MARRVSLDDDDALWWGEKWRCGDAVRRNSNERETEQNANDEHGENDDDDDEGETRETSFAVQILKPPLMTSPLSLMSAEFHILYRLPSSGIRSCSQSENVDHM